MGGATTIGVVIPTLGERAALDHCLKRLADQDDPGPFEVFLVADAAVKDMAALKGRFAASGLPGRVLRATRAGASAARNAGWRASDAPVVLFLDDDVWAGPRFLAAHRSVHEADPSDGVGALGRLRWASTLRVTPFMRFIEDGVQFDTENLAKVSETRWWHLYTCNCSLKRRALERVGGLDEVGFPYGYEDLDLGLRLDGALPDGLRLRVVPEAEAEHFQPMTLSQWRVRVTRIARSERRFVARYPEIEPFFHRRFSHALVKKPPRGRAVRLAPWVPAWTPWLGPRVEELSRLWFEQQLATPFMTAWDAAAGEDPGPVPASG